MTDERRAECHTWCSEGCDAPEALRDDLHLSDDLGTVRLCHVEPERHNDTFLGEPMWSPKELTVFLQARTGHHLPTVILQHSEMAGGQFPLSVLEALDLGHLLLGAVDVVKADLEARREAEEVAP
jgi:hypothetical protein